MLAPLLHAAHYIVADIQTAAAPTTFCVLWKALSQIESSRLSPHDVGMLELTPFFVNQTGISFRKPSPPCLALRLPDSRGRIFGSRLQVIREAISPLPAQERQQRPVPGYMDGMESSCRHNADTGCIYRHSAGMEHSHSVCNQNSKGCAIHNRMGTPSHHHRRKIHRRIQRNKPLPVRKTWPVLQPPVRR